MKASVRAQYKKIRLFSRYLREVQTKGDNDNIIAITGVKGAGKSTLAMQLATDYMKAFYGRPKLNFRKHSAYNNEEVIEKIHGSDPYMPLVCDEAVRFAWSRDWNTSENKELIRLATQIRTKKLILFLNLPKFGNLDKAWRDGLIDIWIWVHYIITKKGKRCFAFLFIPDLNQGQPDAWHMDLFKKRIRNKVFNQFTDFSTVKNYMQKHPCYFDAFEYPPLPQGVYDEYKAIRDERAFETEETKFDKSAIVEAMIYNIRNNFPKMKEDVELQKGPLRNRKYCGLEIIRRHVLVNPISHENLLSPASVTKYYKAAQEAVFKSHPELRKKERERTPPKGAPSIVQEAYAMDDEAKPQKAIVPNYPKDEYVDVIGVERPSELKKENEVPKHADDQADGGSEEEIRKPYGEGAYEGADEEPEIIRDLFKK